MKKVGRPTDNPKETVVRARMDAETVSKLDECAEKLDTSRSEVIRQGINKLHESLEEK